MQAYIAKPHPHTKQSLACKLILILVQPSSAAVERMISILQNSFTHISTTVIPREIIMLLYNVYMLQYKNAEWIVQRIVLTNNNASIILRIIGQLQSIISTIRTSSLCITGCHSMECRHRELLVERSPGGLLSHSVCNVSMCTYV